MDKAFSFKDVQIDMSDIPSYASLNEACLYVTEASNALFDNLKREIGLNELGIFEATGNTISYVVEAGEEENGVVNKGKEVAAKIMKIFEAAAAKIKGMFEVAMRKINELTTKATAGLGGKLNADSMKKGLKYTKISYNCGKFDNLEKFINNGSVLNVKRGANEFNSKGISEYFEGTKEDHTLTDDDAGKKAVDDIVEVISKFVTKNIALKELYKKSTSYLDDRKKEIKSATEIDSESLANIKTQIADATLVYGTAFSTYYKLVRQDVSIAIKLVAAAKKAELKDKLPKKKEEKAAEAEAPKEEKAAEDIKESAVEESVTKTYTEEVESLFNWSF